MFNLFKKILNGLKESVCVVYNIFFRNKNVFFIIFSLSFLSILLYYIGLEFTLQTMLYHLSFIMKFSLFIVLIFVYLTPILIFIFLDINKRTSKGVKLFLYFLTSIYYLFIFFLVAYLAQIRFLFDFYFFYYNIRDVFPTIVNTIDSEYIIRILVFAILVIVSLVIFLKNLRSVSFKKRYLNIFFIFLFLILLATITRLNILYGVRNPAILEFFSRTFSTNEKMIRDYNERYTNVLNQYSNISIDDFMFSETHYRDDVDIYFIHLESINSELVNKVITPEFVKYSDNYGVRFVNFFSNTTQSLRAEESILCAVPPSLNMYLIDSYNLERLICLPAILDNIGYKTIFFKSHDLKFTQSGDFMEKIGFSEIYNSEIMHKDDPKLAWGYREDVFFKRVLEYLEKDKTEKKFIYIAVSSTNHYPFDSSYFKGELPFKGEDFLSKISNTTYIQDYYLGGLLEELINDKKQKYIFIYSDNAWPIGLHENNYFNEGMAYKENFSIPFAFLVVNDKNNKFNIGSIVEEYYSQIDIFNTILDLLDIDVLKRYLGDSFHNELLKLNDNQLVSDNGKCVLNIQPYYDKYFSFFIEDKHYIYNIFKKEFVFYNLKIDPNEQNPIYISGEHEIYKIYNKCTNFSDLLELEGE